MKQKNNELMVEIDMKLEFVKVIIEKTISSIDDRKKLHFYIKKAKELLIDVEESILEEAI